MGKDREFGVIVLAFKNAFATRPCFDAERNALLGRESEDAVSRRDDRRRK